MAAKNHTIINPCGEISITGPIAGHSAVQFIHLDTHMVGSNAWHTLLVNGFALDWIKSNFLAEEDFFARKTDLLPQTIIVNEKILVLMTLKWQT